MTDSFCLGLGLFRGHAVETQMPYWRAKAFCEDGPGGPKTVDTIVSNFWDQSQRRLQVDRSFFCRWSTGIAGPIAATATFAWQDAEAMARRDPSGTAPTSALGSQKDLPGAATALPQRGASGAHHRQVVAANEADTAGADAVRPKVLDWCGRC